MIDEDDFNMQWRHKTIRKLTLSPSGDSEAIGVAVWDQGNPVVYLESADGKFRELSHNGGFMPLRDYHDGR